MVDDPVVVGVVMDDPLRLDAAAAAAADPYKYAAAA